MSILGFGKVLSIEKISRQYSEKNVVYGLVRLVCRSPHLTVRIGSYNLHSSGTGKNGLPYSQLIVGKQFLNVSGELPDSESFDAHVKTVTPERRVWLSTDLPSESSVCYVRFSISEFERYFAKYSNGSEFLEPVYWKVFPSRNVFGFEFRISEKETELSHSFDSV